MLGSAVVLYVGLRSGGSSRAKKTLTFANCKYKSGNRIIIFAFGPLVVDPPPVWKLAMVGLFVCLLTLNSSFWMEASGETMALLGPPDPEIPLPDQFPFSSFTQNKNFCFRLLIFPLDFVSRCV